MRGDPWDPIKPHTYLMGAHGDPMGTHVATEIPWRPSGDPWGSYGDHFSHLMRVLGGGGPPPYAERIWGQRPPDVRVRVLSNGLATHPGRDDDTGLLMHTVLLLRLSLLS